MKLWQELRRRRVFRLAGLYVVGAWLIIQVADISFPAWGLPDSAIRYLFIAAIACFPVALIFSWLYDITPRGIVRTEPAGEAEPSDLRLKRADYLILTALLVVAVAVVLSNVGKIREEIGQGPADSARSEKKANSIAVLPFANLDARPDTGYFSDGITEEILHRLSTMGLLHVLASTSSFAFRDSEETPASICDKLGVMYLLQGSIRRDGDFVRVTARLLDEGGFQVWSDRFDRKLESIFAVQTEIASKVSGEILNEIIPPRELPAGRTTENVEAYNAYLRGRAYFDARTTDWKDRARTEFERAIELDPGFAPPYAGMGTLVVNSSHGPKWEEARDFAEKALELDPQLPLAWAVLGMTTGVLGEYERGVESLRKAIELDPSLGTAYSWITGVLKRLGRHEEAARFEQRGLEIDPLNPVLLRNAAQRENSQGNLARAEQLVLRLAGLPEPPHWTFWTLSQFYANWGLYGKALAAAKEGVRLAAGTASRPPLEAIALSYASAGLVEDAEYWLDEIRSQTPDGGPRIILTMTLARHGAGLGRLSEALEQMEALRRQEETADDPDLLTDGGLAWLQAGDLTRGIEWLEQGIALHQRDMAPDDAPENIDYDLLDQNWPMLWVVGVAERAAFAYRRLGQDEKADAAMQFLEGAYAAGTDMTHPEALEQRALIRALAGDTAGAVAHLEQALALGWAGYYGVMNDPAWAQALETREVQTVLAKAKANMERQRSLIEAADAEHDFRAEYAQLYGTAQQQRSADSPP